MLEARTRLVRRVGLGLDSGQILGWNLQGGGKFRNDPNQQRTTWSVLVGYYAAQLSFKVLQALHITQSHSDTLWNP